MIDRGADFYAQDSYALRLAAGSGNLEVVKLLIDRGVDIHAKNEHALHWAAGNGYLEVVGCSSIVVQIFMQKATSH